MKIEKNSKICIINTFIKKKFSLSIMVKNNKN